MKLVVSEPSKITQHEGQCHKISDGGVGRSVTEAFPWDEAPRYLIRDRDRIFSCVVTRRLRAMGIRDKPIAPGSPWQNGYAERLIGTIRRECLDHVIVFRREYAAYCNGSRTHRALNQYAPVHRPVQSIGPPSHHDLFSVVFTINMSGFEFSAHTAALSEC